MINEKKLSALIKRDSTRIVNLFDDYFEYCNGYILAVCNYDNHKIIQTLFNVGALENYRNLTAITTRDLTDIKKTDIEFEAERTQYIKDFGSYQARVFKIQGKHYIYNTSNLDVFKWVTYKASMDKSSSIPVLRIYENEKLVGLVLPIRDRYADTDDVISKLEA
jgi:hypothetical protein